MSGYVDHGWRHAPKADGGTDPVPGLGGGGTDENDVIYDSYDHVGSWLSIYTNNADEEPEDIGITIENVYLGAVTIKNSGPDGTLIQDGGGDGIIIRDTGGGDIAITSTTDIFVAGDTVKVRIQVGSGDYFQIEDQFGNPLLRINADGTLQMKTGGDWVADL